LATITDRKKDVIIRNGVNVSAEVENALLQLPAIVEVAVVGRPDARTGERAGDRAVAARRGRTRPRRRPYPPRHGRARPPQVA
jgi:acyl-coenzyme A synthetase/AMP-(fatty) acid ligase